MRGTHKFTDDSATIHIEGLTAPVRMLQLTDTLMHFYDERDGEKVEACAISSNAARRIVGSCAVRGRP